MLPREQSGEQSSVQSIVPKVTVVATPPKVTTTAPSKVSPIFVKSSTGKITVVSPVAQKLSTPIQETVPTTPSAVASQRQTGYEERKTTTFLEPASDYISQQQNVIDTTQKDIEQAKGTNINVFKENITNIGASAQSIRESYKFLEPYGPTDTFTLVGDTSGKTYTKTELEARLKNQEAGLLFSSVNVAKALTSNVVVLAKAKKEVDVAQSGLTQFSAGIANPEYTPVKVTTKGGKVVGAEVQPMDYTKWAKEVYASPGYKQPGVASTPIDKELGYANALVQTTFDPAFWQEQLLGDQKGGEIYYKNLYESQDLSKIGYNVDKQTIDPLKSLEYTLSRPLVSNVVIPAAMMAGAGFALESISAASKVAGVAGKVAFAGVGGIMVGASVVPPALVGMETGNWKELQTNVIGLGMQLPVAIAGYSLGAGIASKAKIPTLTTRGDVTLGKIDTAITGRNQDVFPGMTDIQKAQKLEIKSGDVITKYDNIRLGTKEGVTASSDVSIDTTNIISSGAKIGERFVYTEDIVFKAGKGKSDLFVEFPGSKEFGFEPSSKIISIGSSEVVGARLTPWGESEPLTRIDILTGMEKRGPQIGDTVLQTKRFIYDVIEPGRTGELTIKGFGEFPKSETTLFKNIKLNEKTGLYEETDVPQDWFGKSSGAQPLGKEGTIVKNAYDFELVKRLNPETKGIEYVDWFKESSGVTKSTKELEASSYNPYKEMFYGETKKIVKLGDFLKTEETTKIDVSLTDTIKAKYNEWKDPGYWKAEHVKSGTVEQSPLETILDTIKAKKGVKIELFEKEKLFFEKEGFDSIKVNEKTGLYESTKESQDWFSKYSGKAKPIDIKPEFKHDIRAGALEWLETVEKAKASETGKKITLESNVYKGGEKSIGSTGLDIALEKPMSNFEKSLLLEELYGTPIFNRYPPGTQDVFSGIAVININKPISVVSTGRTTISDADAIFKGDATAFFDFKSEMDYGIDFTPDLKPDMLPVSRHDLISDIISGTDLIQTPDEIRDTIRIPDMIVDVTPRTRQAIRQDMFQIEDTLTDQMLITDQMFTYDFVTPKPPPGLPGLPSLDLTGYDEYGDSLIAVFGRTRKYKTGSLKEAFAGIGKL